MSDDGMPATPQEIAIAAAMMSELRQALAAVIPHAPASESNRLQTTLASAAVCGDWLARQSGQARPVAGSSSARPQFDVIDQNGCITVVAAVNGRSLGALSMTPSEAANLVENIIEALRRRQMG